MVFFNDPLAGRGPRAPGDPARDRRPGAVRRSWRGAWRKRGTELGLGIGIEAGYATVGRIGFEGRYDYGALGPVTNLASRLSTRAAAGQTLIGPRVFAAVEETVETLPLASST